MPSKKSRLTGKASKDLPLPESKDAKVGGGTVITNLANMRHEMLKSVAQNLRA